MPNTFNIRLLRTDARRVGMTFGEIAEILAKWGPAILQLVIQGLRNGLSLAFLKEILTVLGPLFLKQAVESALFKQSAKGAKQKSVLSPLAWENVGDCSDCCIAEEQCPVGTCCEPECPCYEGFAPPLAVEPPFIEGEKVDNFDEEQDIALSLLLKLIDVFLNKYGVKLAEWLIEIIGEALTDPRKRAKLDALLQRVPDEA